MTGARVTLFVERLPAWVRAVPQARLEALEWLIARGRALPVLPADPDRARLALFGVSSQGAVPAGALTRAADSGTAPGGYWLRADPVALRASLTQVYVVGVGMADFDVTERREIIATVRAELARAGLDLKTDHPERWTLPLTTPLPFDFAPLADALGADVAELLPAHGEARAWRQLLTELQIALHNHPVNERRRAAGRRTVNGVWFWGGGPAPSPPADTPFQRVHADHPVSAGLARCCGIEAGAAPGATPEQVAADGPVFIDWPEDDPDPERALQRLEQYLAALRPAAMAARIDLRLFAGDGRGWRAGGSRWRRWWCRRRPLAESFGPANPS
jgi:hypothetical protein